MMKRPLKKNFFIVSAALMALGKSASAQQFVDETVYRFSGVVDGLSLRLDITESSAGAISITVLEENNGVKTTIQGKGLQSICLTNNKWLVLPVDQFLTAKNVSAKLSTSDEPLKDQNAPDVPFQRDSYSETGPLN